MIGINPLAQAIVQSTTVQREQSVEKDRLLRQSRQLSRNTALQHDEREQQVGSSKEREGISDDDGSAGGGQYSQAEHEEQHKFKERRAADRDPDSETHHLDITA